MVDKLQIEQALLNLMHNSMDAIGKAGRGIISIEAALAGADFIEVRVRDSGPGFPINRIANPFLPFSSTKEEGLGIGLPLCRSIIEAHGGRIWIDTELPGATVCFTLPDAKFFRRDDAAPWLSQSKSRWWTTMRPCSIPCSSIWTAKTSRPRALRRPKRFSPRSIAACSSTASYPTFACRAFRASTSCIVSMRAASSHRSS